MASAFITFEGTDGSGKSTQLRMLASELRLRGHEVVSTREPGGTPLGAHIRQLVLEAEEHVDPLAELLLYAADRAQHVRTLIRPAVESVTSYSQTATPTRRPRIRARAAASPTK